MRRRRRGEDGRAARCLRSDLPRRTAMARIRQHPASADLLLSARQGDRRCALRASARALRARGRRAGQWDGPLTRSHRVWFVGCIVTHCARLREPKSGTRPVAARTVCLDAAFATIEGCPGVMYFCTGLCGAARLRSHAESPARSQGTGNPNYWGESRGDTAGSAALTARARQLTR
jgi:hypothetical protein